MTETMARKRWYEQNPSRLNMEKMALGTIFPEFEFSMINNGGIRYSGTLKSEKFKRLEGYCVNVDFYDGGLDNCGNPGIVISPTSPDFNDLFPTSFAYSEELQRKLLNQVAIDMKCVGYEDPATEQTPTLITAASLLKKLIDWFCRYEAEKDRLEQRKIELMDARKRQDLINRLKNGTKVSFLGEIGEIGRTVKNFGNKCSSYFNLLPEKDLCLSSDIASSFIKACEDSGYKEIPKADENLSLNPRIHPIIILDQFSKILSIRDKQDFRIFHFPLPGGGYYSFSTDKIEFPFTAESLILFYFLKNATSYFLPLIWHSCYGKRTLILSSEDIPLPTSLSKDIDYEKLKKLPVGLEIPDSSSDRTFRFNFYYWHDWTGYIKCNVLIKASSDSMLLNESNINIEETKSVLFHYNCGIRY